MPSSTQARVRARNASDVAEVFLDSAQVNQEELNGLLPKKERGMRLLFTFTFLCCIAVLALAAPMFAATLDDGKLRSPGSVKTPSSGRPTRSTTCG
jgi:hypothetical protein